MCGIVGAASGSLSQREVNVFEDLMIVSNLRGRQGSGIVTVTRDVKKEHHLHCIKVVGSGIQAIGSSEYRKRIAEGTPSVLIGHTRWPTKGGTDLDAVHPHIFDKVVGVHNGTLTRVNQDYVLAKESDSNLLYKSINEDGIEEALAKSRGAYALVFIDSEKQTLNFIRNHERPLWFAKVRWNQYGKTLFWASEWGFLNLILTRSGFKKEEYEIVELPTNELWTLEVPMVGQCDFSIQKGVLSDTKAVRPFRSYQGGHKWYEDTFLEKVEGVRSSVVHMPSGSTPVGRETFVWRDGALIAKEAPHQQVFLPRSSSSNESQGAEAVQTPVGQAGSEGLSNEQRPQVAAEVPDRGTTSERLIQDFPGLVKQFLSKEELEFDDDLSDVYANEANMLADPPFEVDDQLALANYGDGDVESLVQTTKNHFLTYSEAKKVLDHGCEYCGNGVTFRDSVCWVGKREFVCEDCSTDVHALIEMNNHFPNSELVTAWKEGRLRGVTRPPESWFNVDGTLDGNKAIAH